MKKMIHFTILSGLLFLSICSGSVQAQQLTANQIMRKVDETMNAPKDQDTLMKVVLIDRNNKEKVREMSLLQKGSERRLVRFLSPADQKGIGFLSLPNDVMYLYLPAFKKVRRIASHVKNSKFAGTDFTYEDMEARNYSDKLDAQLLKTENNMYVLDSKLKPGKTSDYSRTVMWVNTANFYPSRVEMYDKAGRLFKIITMEKVEQVNGYWTSREMTMEDVKAKHKTKMIQMNVKFDSGIPDDKFTERYLSR
ncbi:MAG: outer membrane lipoprotein-sorting protein [bacterium]|nr:outer membrane lipoprotein-sorting protein [bacterium]